MEEEFSEGTRVSGRTPSHFVGGKRIGQVNELLLDTLEVYQRLRFHVIAGSGMVAGP